MSEWKEEFQLPRGTYYFNHAYMSPLPLRVEEAGMEGLLKKKEPWKIIPEHFFEQAEEVREKFARLIHSSARRVAIMPSASYGLAAACNNVDPMLGSHALIVGEEFPSGYYAAEYWCRMNGKQLKIVDRPKVDSGVAKEWNTQILEAIGNDTAMVVLSSVHWTDGTRFDLESIGRRCKETQSVLIIDGTQSVGALPMEIDRIQADVVVCAAYKWLLGPYSTALAYYGEKYDNGVPLENSYLNREGAIHFHKLVEYTPIYEAGAARYNMGQFSQFIHVPMLAAALDLVLAMGPEHIQNHGYKLTDALVASLTRRGCMVEEREGRGGHIFGIRLPQGNNIDELLTTLKNHHIYVSRRGDKLRISTHLYNTLEDVALLQEIMETQLI